MYCNVLKLHFYEMNILILNSRVIVRIRRHTKHKALGIKFSFGS